MRRDSNGRIGNTAGEFSTCQFFLNGTYEYVRRWVSVEEAAEAFRIHTTSVAAEVGIVTRVIITDGGDCINAEWEYGKGIIYPPQEMMRQQ